MKARAVSRLVEDDNRAAAFLSSSFCDQINRVQICMQNPSRTLDLRFCTELTAHYDKEVSYVVKTPSLRLGASLHLCSCAQILELGPQSCQKVCSDER